MKAAALTAAVYRQPGPLPRRRTVPCHPRCDILPPRHPCPAILVMPSSRPAVPAVPSLSCLLPALPSLMLMCHPGPAILIVPSLMLKCHPCPAILIVPSLSCHPGPAIPDTLPCCAILPSNPQVLPALAWTVGPQQDPPTSSLPPAGVHRAGALGSSGKGVTKPQKQPGWHRRDIPGMHSAASPGDLFCPTEPSQSTLQERDLKAPVFTPNPGEIRPK